MRRQAALFGLLAAGALGGCGLGPGSTPRGVQLMVTRDFGAASMIDSTTPALGGRDTVMRLLQRNAKVTTRYGGGFVESIAGLAGGAKLDWFYYVNGLEAPKGAAATVLHDGDHVWWDRHDWSGSMDTRAVVGAFPEPFLHGSDGRRLPVRVECTQPAGHACDAVSRALTGIGIPAARGGLLLAEDNAAYRVLVGPWSQIRADPAAQRIERGPQISGVFARFDASGRKVALLGANGTEARTLGPSTGLVAATRTGDQPVVWVVTGTDASGVDAAAKALDAATLRGHFAVAVADQVGIPLPLAAR